VSAPASRPDLEELLPVRPETEDRRRAARRGWSGGRVRAILLLWTVGILAAGIYGFLLAPFAGFFLFAPGAGLDVWRSWRSSSLRQSHLDEPWMWDHAWDRSGARVTPLERVARVSTFPFAAALFSWAAVHWWFLGAALVWWACRAWSVWGGGTSRVTYAEFPFFVGGRATLRFGLDEGGATFHSARYFLRRVRETPHRFTSVHHADDWYEIEGFVDGDALPGPEQYVEVSFDVPADVGGTWLSGHHPRYWVLDVEGETSAGPYAESFLVPIYVRPRAGDASA
jgi:hypothetical protein